MEPQNEQISPTKEKKSSLSIVVAFLALLLVAALAYIYFDKSTSQSRVDNAESSDKELSKNMESDEVDVIEENEEEVVLEDPAEPMDYIVDDEIGFKADIDEDLKSFDSLELSDIEDDYSEDTLDGLGD